MGAAGPEDFFALWRTVSGVIGGVEPARRRNAATTVWRRRRPPAGEWFNEGGDGRHGVLLPAPGRQIEEGQSVSALPQFSDFDLLGNGEGIVNFDAKVSDRALDVGVAQQELDSPEVAGSTVDQRGLGPANGVRAVERRIEANPFHPLRNQAGVLPGG